jgi:5-methylcytosine-specific restriction endonuclease McrA
VGRVVNTEARRASWRKYSRKRRAEQHEHMLAIQRRSRRKHLARNLERARAWHKAHPRARPRHPKAYQYEAAYRKRHPEVVQRKQLIRRARKAGAGGTFTIAEWVEKCALLGNVCIYCGEERPLVADHDVPVARGGTSSIDNLLPACQPCNARKGTRTAREYLTELHEKPAWGAS